MVKNTENKKQGMALGSSEWTRTVEDGLKGLGVTVSLGMIRQMETHVREMLFWNRTTNLTSITDPYEVAVKHVVDSGAAALLFDGNEQVLDLGTGGGFPGIPLKIIRPSLSMTLVDSSRKKVSFLKQAIRSLRLENIRAVEGRGEELAGSSDHLGRYDVVISRAFSGLDLMIPMALPFLKEEGRIIAMKGRDVDHEAALFKDLAVKRPDGSVLNAGDLELEVQPYELPGTDFQRAFMIIRRKK
jgi:16S rRNA (guanine527-N7)-methyltransferase